MQYMLLIYTDPSSWQDPAALEAMMGEYMTFSQAIVDSGEFVHGAPLEGRETATTVRVRGGETSTTDGPFAEIKEHIGGYYLVDVKDLDRALELAAKLPDARSAAVEVRPIREMGTPS